MTVCRVDVLSTDVVVVPCAEIITVASCKGRVSAQEASRGGSEGMYRIDSHSVSDGRVSRRCSGYRGRDGAGR